MDAEKMTITLDTEDMRKVYDAGQIAAYRERERQKAVLVDAFYMALKANGGDQNAAKAAQREKAVQWNAVEVFNEIYA